MSSAGIKVRHLTFEGLLEIHDQVSNQPKDKIRFANKGNLDYCIETTEDRNEALELIDKLIDMAAHHLRCLAAARGFSDQNKTTAYQATDTFLRANRFQLNVPEIEIDEVVLLMRRVTTGQISLQNIKDWIREHIIPFPTKLQKPIESYQVTYTSEELKSIPVNDVKDISAAATKENAALLKALMEST